MARRAFENVMDLADQLRDQAAEAACFGRLLDDTARSLKSACIIAVPGETHQVAHVGSEVQDGAALQRVRVSLERGGVAVKPLLVEEAEARRVEDVISFTDPIGTAVEVFFGLVLDHSPVLTPLGATFVTGARGHAVLPVMGRSGALTSYTEVLGFLPRGALRLPAPTEFGSLRIWFFGVHERYHSVVLCPAPQGGPPGVVHIMVEVDSGDSVAYTLDRVARNGFSLSSTLRRHTNDKVVSFYARAPGGWEIEFGTDGMKVDEMHYTAEQITADSHWRQEWSRSQLLAAM